MLLHSHHYVGDHYLQSGL